MLYKTWVLSSALGAQRVGVQFQIPAFYGCVSLEKIIIENKDIKIGYDAFGECSSLKEIIIGNKKIDEYKFEVNYSQMMEFQKLKIYCDNIVIRNEDIKKYNEDILYDHKTQKFIPDTIYHEKLNIPKYEDVYVCGKNDLFALVIIMKYLLRDEEFREMMQEIKSEVEILDVAVDVIPISKVLNKIGFPKNWYDITDMK